MSSLWPKPFVKDSVYSRVWSFRLCLYKGPHMSMLLMPTSSIYWVFPKLIAQGTRWIFLASCPYSWCLCLQWHQIVCSSMSWNCRCPLCSWRAFLSSSLLPGLLSALCQPQICVPHCIMPTCLHLLEEQLLGMNLTAPLLPALLEGNLTRRQMDLFLSSCPPILEGLQPSPGMFHVSPGSALSTVCIDSCIHSLLYPDFFCKWSC